MARVARSGRQEVGAPTGDWPLQDSYLQSRPSAVVGCRRLTALSCPVVPGSTPNNLGTPAPGANRVRAQGPGSSLSRNLGIARLVGTGVTTAPPPQVTPPAGRRRRWWNIVWAIFSAAMFALGCIVNVHEVYGWFLHSEPITVDLTDKAVIPRCLTVSGTAAPPSGKMLLEAHHSKVGRYYYNKPSMGKDDQFSLSMNVGGASSLGSTFTIELFYLDESNADFALGVGGTGPDGADGQGFTMSLPPGSSDVVRRTVQRDEKRDEPPC
jgi:hypothetical protein